MAEITKDSTLREVLTYYADKNKRKQSFVTEGVKLFKDIADEKGSALKLFTPDKNKKTLLNKVLSSIDPDSVGLKQPMQNLRQVGLALKGVIPETDPAYDFLPDKQTNSEKNLKIFGIEEPEKAKSLVSIKVNPQTMNELFSKIEEFKLDPKTEAIADAMLFNLNTGLRPNVAGGLKVGGVYFPENGAIYITAETKGAKGRRVNVPLSPLADSILQKRIADGKVKDNQFFVKPDGKVVTSTDMTNLLKQIKIKDIIFDASTDKYYDSLAPEGKDVPGKRGSSLFRNIHTKIGQKAGVPFERIAYLQGRSLVAAAQGSVGEVITYATDFPGDIDPQGFDAQKANQISSIFQPSVEKYGYDLSAMTPRITPKTAGFENYFDAPAVPELDATITNNGNTLLDSKVEVSSIEDFTAEEIEELKNGGINLEPSTTKKILKSAATIAGTVVSKTAKSIPIVSGVPEYFEAKEAGDPEDIARAKGMMGAVSPIMPSDIKAGEELVGAVAEPLVEEAKESMQEQDVGFLGGLMTSFGYPTAGSFAAGGFITKRK
jgi:integrase